MSKKEIFLSGLTSGLVIALVLMIAHAWLSFSNIKPNRATGVPSRSTIGCTEKEFVGKPIITTECIRPKLDAPISAPKLVLI